MLPLQIVIPSELEEEDFKTLRLMMPNADEKVFHTFMEEAHGYTDKADRQDASAVLHVITASNKELFKKIWEEQTMQDYLTELMSDKFEEAIQGERKTIIENMLRKGKTPEEISSLTGLALEHVQKFFFEKCPNINLSVDRNFMSTFPGLMSRFGKNYS